MNKRQEFTAKVKAQAFQRCGGKCEHCSNKLLRGDINYDHKISDKILRDHGISSTDIDNIQVLCVACHKIETRRDMAEIVKRRKQLKKQESGREGKAKGKSFPSGAKIQSGGFNYPPNYKHWRK